MYELLMWQKTEQKHHDSMRPNLFYFEAIVILLLTYRAEFLRCL